jgi:hypothetical protein
MLIFDGFGSHLIFDFIKYCWDNDIISLCLLLYIIYFIQSLDVVLFQLYKYYHGEAVDRAVRQGLKIFIKIDFLALFNGIRSQTFKPFSIKSSFAEIDLIL